MKLSKKAKAFRKSLDQGLLDEIVRQENAALSQIFGDEESDKIIMPAEKAEQDTLWPPEVGKYGRTRDGCKVGPIELSGIDEYPYKAESRYGPLLLYSSTGSDFIGSPSENDLVSEWEDECACGSGQSLTESEIMKIAEYDPNKLLGSFWISRSGIVVDLTKVFRCFFTGRYIFKAEYGTGYPIKQFLDHYTFIGLSNEYET